MVHKTSFCGERRGLGGGGGGGGGEWDGSRGAG